MPESLHNILDLPLEKKQVLFITLYCAGGLYPKNIGDKFKGNGSSSSISHFILNVVGRNAVKKIFDPFELDDIVVDNQKLVRIASFFLDLAFWM